MSRLWILGTIVALCAGCAENRAVRGWVPQPRPGNPLIDFTFIEDERGSPRSLRELLGDFTVLSFTQCDRDTHGPAVDLLAEIVRENSQSAPFVRVVGVDIHRPSNRIEPDGRCHLIEQHADIASICDGTRAVSQLYGVGQEDWLVLVDPNQCISFSGPMRSADQLRTQLRKQVARLRQTKDRGHFGGYRGVG